jgi:hypothetical protein
VSNYSSKRGFQLLAISFSTLLIGLALDSIGTFFLLLICSSFALVSIDVLKKASREGQFQKILNSLLKNKPISQETNKSIEPSVTKKLQVSLIESSNFNESNKSIVHLPLLSVDRPIEFSSSKELAFPGCYLYSYPSYLKTPNNFRYRIKIGMTGNTITSRVNDQKRQTAMAEDPFIIFAIKTQHYQTVEAHFHRRLKENRINSNTGGKEWFWVSITEIDTIARELDSLIEEFYTNRKWNVNNRTESYVGKRIRNND